MIGKGGFSMNKKATDIVAYLSIVGWLVAYFAGDRGESRFHLNQGLVLAIGEIILSIAGKLFHGSILLSLVVWLADVLLFVVWLTAFVSACKGEEKPMPILGGIQIL